MSMTKENFDLWVRALRSGRYRRAERQLRGVPVGADRDEDAYGYCCLGVYCEERGVNLSEWAYNTEHDTDDLLAEFGGVVDAQIHGTPLEPVLGELTEPQRSQLARRNDNGDSFAAIADYLVEHESEFVDGE